MLPDVGEDTGKQVISHIVRKSPSWYYLPRRKYDNVTETVK